MDAVVKAKRSTVRTQTTKLFKKIETKLFENNYSEDDLEELFAELELKEKELSNLDAQIFSTITKTDEVESEVLKCDEYNTGIVINKSKISKAISKLKKPLDNISVQNNKTNESAVVRQFESPYVNLPRLTIEKFNGDPSDWQRFYDQFDSAINQNSQISKVDKFNYLRSYLTGVAVDAIKGFSLTNNNYQAALETLKERFGKKTVVVNSHLNKLLNLTPVKKSSDIVALRKLLDICQTEIRNLDALEIKSDMYGSLLCPILIKLLPQDIVLEIAKQCDLDENWDVSRVLNILKTEITYREKAQFLTKDSCDRAFSSQSNSSFHNAKNEKFQGTKSVTKYPTASNLLNDTGKNSSTCFACNTGNHVLTECKVFSSYPLQRKKEILMKYGFCFICLKRLHIAKFCKSHVKCEVCNKRHLKIMCSESKADNHLENKKPASKGSEVIDDKVLGNKTHLKNVLLQTLTVKLRNGKKEIPVRVIFDTGSMRSYATKEIIFKMGYNVMGQETMTHSLFGGVEETRTHNCYRIHISSLSGDYLCNFEVYDQELICSNIPKIRNGPWVREAEQYGIKFSDLESVNKTLDGNDSVDILIGADIYGKLLTGNYKLLSSGLAAVETLLGWTLMGKISETNCNSDSSMLVVSLFARNEKISDLWELDLLGIRDPAESKRRDDLDKETLDLFNSTVKRDSSGRYIVSLPWLKDHPPIPSNRKLAEKRLLSTVKSLKASGNLESYQNVFKDWLNEGIIKKISDSGENGHFLPHRAVIRQHATTPVRPVFDASAKEKFSYSLNDCLAKGPNLIELIPAILHRFRKGKIGISADIKKAFCQIRLNNNDQNFVKFLWFEDGDCNKLQIYQHCRVVFGINASPFLLAATLNHLFDRIEEPYKRIANKLKTSFYVDNCLSSVNSTEELEEFIKTSRQILASAQFDLRGWQYTENDENILDEDFLNKTKIESEENFDVVVLGLIWNKKDDTIKLMNSSDREESKTITKRSVLSVINKIYDPIGYTTPATLMPKLMLQKCWKEKFNWDSPLTEEMTKSFKKWEEQLELLRNIKIPRRISEIDLKDSEKHLHVFCDSSKVAYATCIFLRVQNGENVSCQLIQAKTRVAPLKEVTIPRLELLACLIGARLAGTIIEEIKIENLKTFYWTDAKNALYWIKKDGGWTTFVQNRVTEIRRLSNVDNWHHVPGHLNPADLPSRGCSPETLKKSQWWNGPDWLKKMPEFWPKSDILPDDEVIYSEKRKTVATALDVPAQEFDFYENCSSYKKMLKVTAWILRFCENAKKSKENRLLSNLTVEELNKAEYVMLKYAQKKCFSSRSKSMFNFPTFVDEKELIRVRTRISMRKDSRNFRYPVVLPANHNITSRIIEEKHKEMDHAGVQILMSSLREEFWIIRCRKTIRKILQKCIQCKRFSSKAAKMLSAPLPEDRVKDAGVFEIIGVDLCGPLFQKDGQKCWIVLYTCAIYRCVHLELATSLSTENFLQTLRRFIARRGRPHTIYSDNGTNLVSANKELSSVDWKQIEDYTTVRKIKWKFNPPSAPWWGGFWERLISIVKSILKRVLGKAHLNYEELYTLICDTESIVNARPLTYMSEDPNDLTPLTPEMFLKDIRETGVPDLDFIEKTKLKKRYAYRQKVREDLRRRFRTEYLGTLREFNFVKKSTTLKEGDLVLVQDDNLKRIQWPMAKVLKLYKGRDGQFRVAKLKTKNGELLRPCQRLCPLELNDEKPPGLKQQTRYGRTVQPVQRFGRNNNDPD